MLTEVTIYLEEVRRHLHLAPAVERQVLSELYTHFQESLEGLRQQGLSEKEATHKAIDSFGRARVVARLMYEAYSKGSWLDALMACIPHLIVASLFAFHLWQNTIVSSLAFTIIVAVTILGWWWGKPCWIYSWMGYSLIPILVISFISWNTTPPNLWLLGLILLYYGLATWLIVRISIRVVRRDWILASFLLAPLPIIGFWLYSLKSVGNLFQYPLTLGLWDMPMALTAAVLAITSAAFIRLRPRALKVGAVITVSSIALTMMARQFWGDVGFFGLVGFSLAMLFFLFLPALLRIVMVIGQPGRARRGEESEANIIAKMTGESIPHQPDMY